MYTNQNNERVVNKQYEFVDYMSLNPRSRQKIPTNKLNAGQQRFI